MGITKEQRKRNIKLFEEGKRFCTKCKEIKEVSEFYRSNTIKHITIPYTSICKQCSSKKAKKYYQQIKYWLLKRKENKHRNNERINLSSKKNSS